MSKIFTFNRQAAQLSTADGGKHKRRSYLALVCLLPVLAVNDVGAQDSQPATSYYDDTFETLTSEIETNVLSGGFGYEPYRLSEPPDGQSLIIDARQAEFVVANSKNPDPSYDYSCELGSLVVNPYPVNVYHADMTAVVGGIVFGEVPQETDWEPTYCNSAAVLFKYASAGMIDGVRITGAWDAFRMASDSPRLTVRNSWISNVRDDVLENDYFYSAVFEDNLVDGTFQGISVHSGGDILTESPETVVVSGNVIRIREYLYKSERRFGALFKSEAASPRSMVHNTVVAVDYQGGGTFSRLWDLSWSNIQDCSNNVFLWLSDLPIPSSVSMPPSSCFTVVTGSEAREAWAQARQNWINCHPNVQRASGDPESNHSQCIPNTFGGYSRDPSATPLPPHIE